MAAPIKWHDEWILENCRRYPTYKALAEAYEQAFGERVDPDSLNEHSRLKLGISRTRAVDWHDEWILENFREYPSYKAMAERHNELFGTDATGGAMKQHARYALGIQKPRLRGRPYTEEQVAWLKEHYPRLGCRKTVEMFNETFGESRTFHSMKNFGTSRGVQVDERVAAFNRTDPSHGSCKAAKPLGSIREESGRLLMKTENGWESVGRAVVKASGKDIPKGHSVIHLDGHTSNYALDNLAVVPNRWCGLLMAHGMRSESAEITRAGVTWCELYDLVKDYRKGENDESGI